MRGRPIRFLTLMMAGWLGVRTTLLWPEPPRVERPAEDFVPHAFARTEQRPPRPVPHDSVLPTALAWQIVPPATAGIEVANSPRSEHPRRPAPLLMSDARILALFGLRHYVELPAPASGNITTSIPPSAATPPPMIGALPHVLPSRWSLSGWVMVRPGGGDPRLVPLLGGSQAGARLSYAIEERRQVAAFVRVAAPLGRSGGEAAAGIEWRPPKLPLAVYAEVRGRDDAGVAPAAGIYGGALRDRGAYRLEGYGQAGLVGGKGRSGFVEGQLRATRRIGADLDGGLGVWGAAQRGAARLDIGPTLGVKLPLVRGARLTLEWRQRIAGEARPNSGPAISLGTDF